MPRPDDKYKFEDVRLEEESKDLEDARMSRFDEEFEKSRG